MKYCQHCGKEIVDEAVVCPGCGCAVQPKSVAQTSEIDTSVSGGLVFLAILIPLFGIIYWPVKAKTRPNCAMACGIAGIVSWVISFIILMAMEGM